MVLHSLCIDISGVYITLSGVSTLILFTQQVPYGQLVKCIQYDNEYMHKINHMLTLSNYMPEKATLISSKSTITLDPKKL